MTGGEEGMNGGSSPKDEKEIPLAEIKQSPGLFRKRLAGDTVEIAGVTFSIQAIPSSVRAFIFADRVNRAGLPQGALINYDTVRFGVTAIGNLKDEDGKDVPVEWETVKVEGRFRKRLALHIMDGFPHEAIVYLSIRIGKLNRLSEEEMKRLDFFTLLQPEGTEETESSAPAS